MRSIQPSITAAVSMLANHVYETAAVSGFHDNDEANSSRFAEFVANMHGEVSELFEAYRKGNLHARCDKPVDLSCAEEELADIIIRALDTAATLKIDIGKAIEIKDAYNQRRERMHGKIC